MREEGGAGAPRAVVVEVVVEVAGRGAIGEEGLREEGDGVRVRVGCSVIYQGNTMRTIGSTIDGCKSLGYLGQHALLCLLFSFSFFLFIAAL
jgi:hypothetical protein